MEAVRPAPERSCSLGYAEPLRRDEDVLKKAIAARKGNQDPELLSADPLTTEEGEPAMIVREHQITSYYRVGLMAPTSMVRMPMPYLRASSSMPIPLAPSYAAFQAWVLEENHRLAAWLGLDPRLTVSSNIARNISQRTGVSFKSAKRWFHGGVAGFLALAARAFGAGWTMAAGIAAILYRWLESFDSSSRIH